MTPERTRKHCNDILFLCQGSSRKDKERKAEMSCEDIADEDDDPERHIPCSPRRMYRLYYDKEHKKMEFDNTGYWCFLLYLFGYHANAAHTFCVHVAGHPMLLPEINECGRPVTSVDV